MNGVSHTFHQNKKLVILFILSLGFFLSYRFTEKKQPRDIYNLMFEAAQKTKVAIIEIQRFRLEKKVAIDPRLDPNQTGLVGEEFTPITTTLGNLEAKQTALNPDFAALLVRWLKSLDLTENDHVALQLSASFPSLNIAAIIACEILQLKPHIASSIGASSYGANIPTFTYLDMEKKLFEKKIIQSRSSFVTCGGEADNGSSLWQGGYYMITEAASRNGYNLIQPSSLENAIQQKLDFFYSQRPINVFINVGGNQSALGNCPHSLILPKGLLTSYQFCMHDNRGLIMHFLSEKVPVLQLLDIRSLALENGLPLTPVPFPEIGKSSIYYHTKRSKAFAIISIIFILTILILFFRPLKYPLFL
jgi:poly-gamma-glutamate system protein